MKCVASASLYNIQYLRGEGEAVMKVSLIVYVVSVREQVQVLLHLFSLRIGRSNDNVISNCIQHDL